jgi:ABC-2 type transport system permease protein
MYALQDYIGEEKVNLAAKNFMAKYQFGGPPYPTSLNFYSYLKEQTPDSLKETLADLFERITIFDNRCTQAKIIETSDKRYQVTLDISLHKYYADSIGNEKEVKLNEWMDVGAVDEDNNLLFSKKVKVKSAEQSIIFTMDKKPFKAGIDPMNKLIDKDADDNLKTVGN